MKLELETIDVPFIQRKVVEEEKRTGQRVVRVLLGRSDWYEFAKDVGIYNMLPTGAPPSLLAYRIVIPSRTSATCRPHYDYSHEVVRTVEVIPDFT